jgi:hypothetical protein
MNVHEKWCAIERSSTFMSIPALNSSLPDKLPHFFYEIAFELLPELNYDDVVYLSLLAKTQHREAGYSQLVDAVRKTQWAKLSALDALTIDATLTALYEGTDTVLNDVAGQIRHARALLELISHGKAALDSLAVFLSGVFNLGFSGGQRDFRHDAFKKKLQSADASLGAFLKAESTWLQRNSPASTSIIAARDECVHRGFLDVAFMWPPSEVGVLPVPKALAATITAAATKTTHYSTNEFVTHHFSRIVKLLGIVITMCIDIEAKEMSPPPARPPGAQKRISAVKFVLTKEITVTNLQQLKVGPFTTGFGKIPIKS